MDFPAVVVKVIASVLAVFFCVSFLNFVWKRDLDVRAYFRWDWAFNKTLSAWFPENPNLVRNGDFERELQSWGSGWIEALPGVRDFARLHKYVPIGGAQALWRYDATHGLNGGGALRVDHRSDAADGVYSTFSQQIAVEPRTRYIASYQAWVEWIGNRGSLALQIGVSDDVAFDMGKGGVTPLLNHWQPVEVPFVSDDREFVDVRFLAEGPIRALIDDVRVKRAR